MQSFQAQVFNVKSRSNECPKIFSVEYKKKRLISAESRKNNSEKKKSYSVFPRVTLQLEIIEGEEEIFFLIIIHKMNGHYFKKAFKIFQTEMNISVYFSKTK